MGFWNGLMKGLGFEAEENEKKNKAEIKKTTGATFSLSRETNKEQNNNEQKVVSKPETFAPAGIVIVAPKDQAEVQEILRRVESGESCIINLSAFTEGDRTKVLDFLAGAMFILRGKLQVLDTNLFLLSI